MGTKGKKVMLAWMAAALAVLVPSPALTFGGRFVTAYGLAVAVSALLGTWMLTHLRLASVKARYAKDGPIGVIWRLSPLDLALCVIPASFAGARLLYCLFRFSFYFLEMGPLSVLCTWEGGFLLYGAVLGALLGGAWLARRRGVSVEETLDELAAPGLLSIFVCRLAEGLIGEGVGAWVDGTAFARFPFAVMNDYGEWQLAVFLLEAVAAMMILLSVLRIKAGKGERIMTALLLYACCQIVFESMRMDSCLKIGFVRVSQVISAIVILAVTARNQQRAAGKNAALCRCTVTCSCVACVGVIEWAIDKTPMSNLLLYTLMAALCALMAANALYIKRKDTKA